MLAASNGMAVPAGLRPCGQPAVLVTQRREDALNEHLIDHVLRDDPWSEDSVDVTQLQPQLSIDDAYALQFAQLARRADAGDRIVGYKAAATSLGAQDVLGPDTSVPTVGTLLASHLAEDGDEFTVLPGKTFVEVEIAALTSSELRGPAVTQLDASRAVGSLCPAIEIAAWSPGVDEGRRSVHHSIATHKTNGTVVVGDPRPSTTVPDLRLEGAYLELDGTVVGSGTGVEAMGHPYRVVAAIARLLAAHGLGLEPGMVVMTGSLLAPFVLPPDKRVAVASFTRLGRVSVRFDQRGAEPQGGDR